MKKLLLIGLIIVLISCRNRNGVIPYVPFEIYINIQNPQYNALNGIGGWVYANGGSRGLIIFRSDLNTFVALDRHSTYKPEKPCAIVFVDSNNITATDTCSGAVFQLRDGSPMSGPATVGLQQYRTSFDGNIIRIWN